MAVGAMAHQIQQPAREWGRHRTLITHVWKLSLLETISIFVGIDVASIASTLIRQCKHNHGVHWPWTNCHQFMLFAITWILIGATPKAATSD